MIMRAVTVAAVVCFAVSACLAATGPVQVEDRQHALSAADEHGDAGIKLQKNATAVAARFIQDYITKAVCSYSPEFCAKHQIRKFKILFIYCVFSPNTCQSKTFYPDIVYFEDKFTIQVIGKRYRYELFTCFNVYII